MRSTLLILAGLVMFFFQRHGPAEGANEDALKDCSKELKSYCSAVTPGVLFRA